MSPVFKWLPEEQAWLESQVIADNGHSSTKDRHWLNSLVEEFTNRFPCVAHEILDGILETPGQMQMRWKDIPIVRTVTVSSCPLVCLKQNSHFKFQEGQTMGSKPPKEHPFEACTEHAAVFQSSLGPQARQA